MGYVYLAFAICSEIIGTSALNMSKQFSKLGPSVLVIICYALSFYLLSHVLKTVPIGIAYTIWSGVGIAAISLIGVVFFKQHLDFAGMLGIGCIIVGVVILNGFSNAGH